MEIQSTTDYTLFKTIKGNRLLKTKHVAGLTAAIIKNNLLPLFPITVNESMEVVDGQHRLQVAKDNNLTIYYIVKGGLGLADIQQINSSSKSWNQSDYLYSYISLGNQNYILAKQLLDKYKISITNFILINNNFKAFGYPVFKRGKMVIADPERVSEFLEKVQALRPYLSKQVFEDKHFFLGLNIVLEKTTIEDLIERLDSYGRPINAHARVIDYLRQFEEVVNWGKRGKIIRYF